MENTTSERLKSLRIQQNLSQSEIARRIHVSPSLVSAYEKNERSPSINTLIRLADVLHTTTDYILCRTNDKDNRHTYIDVSGLSDRQVDSIKNMVEAIKTP